MISYAYYYRTDIVALDALAVRASVEPRGARAARRHGPADALRGLDAARPHLPHGRSALRLRRRRGRRRRPGALAPPPPGRRPRRGLPRGGADRAGRVRRGRGPGPPVPAAGVRGRGALPGPAGGQLPLHRLRGALLGRRQDPRPRRRFDAGRAGRGAARGEGGARPATPASRRVPPSPPPWPGQAAPSSTGSWRSSGGSPTGSRRSRPRARPRPRPAPRGRPLPRGGFPAAGSAGARAFPGSVLCLHGMDIHRDAPRRRHGRPRAAGTGEPEGCPAGSRSPGSSTRTRTRPSPPTRSGRTWPTASTARRALTNTRPPG